MNHNAFDDGSNFANGRTRNGAAVPFFRSSPSLVASALACDNRVAMTTHREPAEDMECLCCMDDIDSSNYVEYLSTGEGEFWI